MRQASIHPKYNNRIFDEAERENRRRRREQVQSRGIVIVYSAKELETRKESDWENSKKMPDYLKNVWGSVGGKPSLTPTN